MPHASVHAWLQGPRPFEEGVALLRAAGEGDDTLLFVLDLGETRVARELLEQALEGLRRKAVQAAQRANTPGVPLVTKADIRAERDLMARDPRSDGYAGVQMPPELAEQRDKLPRLFGEMHFYRARLEQTPEKADRYAHNCRILALDADIVRIYARLDAWKATGRDPGNEPPRHKAGIQLQRELQNIVTYLARHNSGARPASPAKVAAWEARKAEVQQLIDALPA